MIRKPKIRKLNNDEHNELKTYASASIIEREEGGYSMSPKDTSAIYLTALSLNKSEIIQLKGFNPKMLNIINQKENFYSFKTSMFNSFIFKTSEYGFYFNENDKRGGSGNISICFLSISKDDKLINQDMYNIINKASIKVILLKDEQKYILDIYDINDWNLFIEKIILDYKPVRIFLKNVSFPECNNFYLKPINAYFNKIYDGLISNFINEKGLQGVKSKELKETYNFNISEYISDISNNNFFIKVENGVIQKIYIFVKTHIFFPYEINCPHNYDEYSFYKKDFKFIKNNNIIEVIDVLELYSEYHNNDTTIINGKVFFIRSEMLNIFNKISSNIKVSKDVLLNNKDTSYYNRLSGLNGLVFEIFKNDSNISVRVKKKNSHNINVILYDRGSNRYDNLNNQVTWFNAIKDGLSFEREKILSVFFIEDFVNNLIELGHENINIELEKPVNKIDGKSGFLDLMVTSEYGGFIYGQAFEFKAIFNYNGLIEQKCYEQSESYDIIHNIIDNYNITKSYDGLNHLNVELKNLII